MLVDRSSYYSRCRFALDVEKKVIAVIRGTLYTKCVLTVSLTTLDADFPLTLKIVIDVIQGTIYITCVLSVPLTTAADDFPLTL